MRHEPDPTTTAMQTVDSDARLIRDFLAGVEPERACATLVDRYWKALVGWIRLRIDARVDAEEIAQATFTRAFRSLSKLESPRRFPAWIFRIAANLATDALRRARRHVSLDTLIDEGRSPAAAAADDPLERRERDDGVLAAVRRLPEKYRLVIVLRYYLELPAKEIAVQLEEPEGTIRNRIFRALAMLRKDAKVREI